MADLHLLWVPLVVLAVVMLFAFTGCQFAFPLEEDEEEESTDTTHGTGPPDLIGVDVTISAGCDAVADAIDIALSTEITQEQYSLTLTSIPSDGQTFSTKDLKIVLEDEGQVVCTVWITPADGEPPPPLSVPHDKVKGEWVPPFTFSCDNGFQLT
jgi:hypothetical protein